MEDETTCFPFAQSYRCPTVWSVADRNLAARDRSLASFLGCCDRSSKGNRNCLPGRIVRSSSAPKSSSLRLLTNIATFVTCFGLDVLVSVLVGSNTSLQRSTFARTGVKGEQAVWPYLFNLHLCQLSSSLPTWATAKHFNTKTSLARVAHDMMADCCKSWFVCENEFALRDHVWNT